MLKFHLELVNTFPNAPLPVPDGATMMSLPPAAPPGQLAPKVPFRELVGSPQAAPPPLSCFQLVQLKLPRIIHLLDKRFCHVISMPS